jgi:hypothetical protein
LEAYTYGINPYSMLPNNYCNVTETVGDNKPGNAWCTGALNTQYIDETIKGLDREVNSS